MPYKVLAAAAQRRTQKKNQKKKQVNELVAVAQRKKRNQKKKVYLEVDSKEPDLEVEAPKVRDPDTLVAVGTLGRTLLVRARMAYNRVMMPQGLPTLPIGKLLLKRSITVTRITPTITTRIQTRPKITTTTVTETVTTADGETRTVTTVTKAETTPEMKEEAVTAAGPQWAGYFDGDHDSSDEED